MNDTTLTKEEKQYKRLTEEPVARLILELGLPTTISMLITNLYNMVDTWFVSQLGTSGYRSGRRGVWLDGNYSGVRIHVRSWRRKQYQPVVRSS